MSRNRISGTSSDPLPGADLDRLRDYLAAERPGLVTGQLSGDVIAGGRSNLTYRLRDDAGARWVLRRPPLGHVLATAHDMTREFRVLSALQKTPLPVPRVMLLCEDADVLGAPFYLMELVAGTAYRRAEQLEPLGPTRTRAICEAMVDTLSTLHSIDPASVGLADFGHPDGFLARQVRRWKQQLDASHTRDLPGLDDLHAALEGCVPPQSATGIVHGDFRLDNLLVDDHDHVTAVLDWEMSTIGDPLTDLALLVAYREIPSGPSTGATLTNTPAAAGFPSSADLIAQYSRTTDRDLSAMGFYVALAYFKLAGVLEGIHYRYTHGQTVGSGFEDAGDLVPPLIAAGLRTCGQTP